MMGYLFAVADTGIAVAEPAASTPLAVINLRLFIGFMMDEFLIEI
jgi:hypothetical protein